MRELVIVGETRNNLTVIKELERAKNGEKRWLCRCSCGKTTTVSSNHFRSGHTKSCGHLLLKHGHSRRNNRSIEYSSWASMRSRCNNKNSNGYKNYGGRGITVCERWRLFINFLEDVGPRPSLNYSLDRIDVNGNYKTGNVRWTLDIAQANNKRPIIRNWDYDQLKSQLERYQEIYGNLPEEVKVG